MRFTALIILFIALHLGAAVPADTLELTKLSEPLQSLTWHVRLEVPNNKPLNFTIMWNVADSSSYCCAVVEARPVSEADFAGRCACTVSIYDVFEGTKKLVSTTEELFGYATEMPTGFSAVLNLDSSGTQLSFGGSVPDISLPIAFNAEHPGAVGLLRSKSTRVLGNLMIKKSRPPIIQSRFADEDTIRAYLSASDDINEGLWEYLDRDVDRERAALGSEYRLATVSVAQGVYSIILLGSPHGVVGHLDVKGTLRATEFIDHYDLEWIASSGQYLDRDTSADFEEGGAVLRLNFPLLSSNVRFRRVLSPKN